jgi:hypothetical protein
VCVLLSQVVVDGDHLFQALRSIRCRTTSFSTCWSHRIGLPSMCPVSAWRRVLCRLAVGSPVAVVGWSQAGFRRRKEWPAHLRFVEAERKSTGGVGTRSSQQAHLPLAAATVALLRSVYGRGCRLWPPTPSVGVWSAGGLGYGDQVDGLAGGVDGEAAAWPVGGSGLGLDLPACEA